MRSHSIGRQSFSQQGRPAIMLVPPDMMTGQSKLLYQLNKFYGERVQARKGTVAKTVREVCKVVEDVLKKVEVQEPWQNYLHCHTYPSYYISFKLEVLKSKFYFI